MSRPEHATTGRTATSVSLRQVYNKYGARLRAADELADAVEEADAVYGNFERELVAYREASKIGNSLEEARTQPCVHEDCACRIKELEARLEKTDALADAAEPAIAYLSALAMTGGVAVPLAKALTAYREASNDN